MTAKLLDGAVFLNKFFGAVVDPVVKGKAVVGVGLVIKIGIAGSAGDAFFGRRRNVAYKLGIGAVLKREIKTRVNGRFADGHDRLTLFVAGGKRNNHCGRKKNGSDGFKNFHYIFLRKFIFYVF